MKAGEIYKQKGKYSIANEVLYWPIMIKVIKYLGNDEWEVEDLSSHNDNAVLSGIVIYNFYELVDLV